MQTNVLELSMDNEFRVHATALAIRQLSRDELEEAFIDMLHQKMVEQQLFLNILKDHGIDATISLNFLNKNELS